MKRWSWRRLLGQVTVVAAITLALDFVLTATIIPRLVADLSATEKNERGVYIDVPYHHDLAPNYETTRVWGNVHYPWRTDHHGLRTGECAPKEPLPGHKQVFVIGDSFTEGLGSTYEASFPGLMACDGARRGEQVWNLGAMSYSPTIYFRKIKAVAERLKVTPNEVFVFLDLSDIDDDANVYHVQPDGTVTAAKASERSGLFFDTARWLIYHFTTVRLVYDAYLLSSFNYSASLARPRARWAFDPALLEAWGRRGLEMAATNLDKVVEQCRDWNCRVTLVVYPWPDNVVAGDKDSLQLRYWKAWAEKNGVRFVDGWTPFFRKPAMEALKEYFIPGDIHFTAAGNRLLFDEVVKATSPASGTNQ